MEISSASDAGTILRTARVKEGMTQQQLADMLHVTRQCVANVEAWAPTARLGLVIDALRCVDINLMTEHDDSQTVLDQVWSRLG